MKRLRLAGYALVGVWSAFWLFFAFASGIGNAGVLRVAIVALLLVGIPVLAWLWPRVGAALLIAEGFFLLGWVYFYLRNPAHTTTLLVLTLAAPPLLAGLLLASGEKADPDRGPRPALDG